jgi:acetoacetyl-CoA synthetase
MPSPSFPPEPGSPPDRPGTWWVPPADLVAGSEMHALARHAGVEDYPALWRWSVEDIERLWRVLWERFDIQASGDPSVVLASHEMPGARWFPDVQLSYPEHIFRDRAPDVVAIRFASEGAALDCWTWGQLREQTARIRAGLQELGVQRGDRVAAYLPNVPEAVAAFLAVGSLGAVWSCCSPDFGARTVADRFAQIEPKVLLAVDGYRYGGRDFDRRPVLAELQAALPSVERLVRLSPPGGDGDWAQTFGPTDAPLSFERVPFEHPLWIVYSSGTTGQPKAIVHGHGGPLLDHLKTWRLHHAVRPDDRALWFTTTGWVMWNYLVSALLTEASIVLVDGNPGYPDMGALWDLVDEAEVSILGVGAAYVHACMKAGVKPREGRRLAALRAIGVTGSPLATEAYHWVAEELGEHVWLASTSGGTEVGGAFLGGSPLMPVRAGELPARMLGAAVEAWDDDGRSVVDEVGELVITQPLPSMPVSLWNDPGHERYRDAYFSTFPGVWRHGDWVHITARGSAVIHGRSDSTINRGGIRIGTAEIYAAVAFVEDVVDALVVDVPPADGPGDTWMGLFVVLADGATLTEATIAELRERIRRDCSPRHVPDAIVAAPEVPRTLTGKLLEVPVKRLLMGGDPRTSANADTLANPAAYEWFVAFARDRGAS